MATSSARDRDPLPPLPLAASVVVSLAVAATIGLANTTFLLSAAGGDIGARLLAVLPIFFLASFAAAQFAFWALRAVVGAFLPLDLRAHALATGLTFLLAGLLHYAESSGVHRLTDGLAAMPEATRGSCPSGRDCAPRPAVEALDRADAPARRAMAENARLDGARFARFARDPDAGVRAALARRSDLPGELLERLAGDRQPEVRAAAAASPRLADETFNRLALDRSEAVRLAVAGNAGTPPSALALLASGTDAEIRLRVAEHPRANEAVRARLLDGRGDAAERAARARDGRR